MDPHQNKWDMDRKISVTDSAYSSVVQSIQTPLEIGNETAEFDFPSTTSAQLVNNWQIESQAKYPDLANIKVRKATFENFWSKQLFVSDSIDNFCETGFFYDSRSDFTRCYMCNVLVCDWRDIHNPADEHWRHQPLCPLTNAPLTKLQNKCPTRTVEQKLLEARMFKLNVYEQLK